MDLHRLATTNVYGPMLLATRGDGGGVKFPEKKSYLVTFEQLLNGVEKLP